MTAKACGDEWPAPPPSSEGGGCALRLRRNRFDDVGNLGNPGNRRNLLGQGFEEVADIALTILRDAPAPPPLPHRLLADTERLGDRAHADTIDGADANHGGAAVLHAIHDLSPAARRNARRSRTMAKTFCTGFVRANPTLKNGMDRSIAGHRGLLDMPMHVRSLPASWLEVAPARSSDYWTVRAQFGSILGRRTL